MIFKGIILCFLVAAAYGRDLQIRNIGAVPLSVSVTGQSDLTVLSRTTVFVSVPEDFSGKVSAVPVGSENADVPRTKAELDLTAAGDLYSVSLKDGFNLRVKIVPIGGTNCDAAVCTANLLALCPVENEVVDSLGAVVACSNSPILFQTVCPKAVVTAGNAINILTCQAASYLILIG